jgi:uncharacterized metal-binding protein
MYMVLLKCNKILLKRNHPHVTCSRGKNDKCQILISSDGMILAKTLMGYTREMHTLHRKSNEIYSSGIIHKEFVLERRNINAQI